MYPAHVTQVGHKVIWWLWRELAVLWDKRTKLQWQWFKHNEFSMYKMYSVLKNIKETIWAFKPKIRKSCWVELNSIWKSQMFATSSSCTNIFHFNCVVFLQCLFKLGLQIETLISFLYYSGQGWLWACVWVCVCVWCVEAKADVLCGSFKAILGASPLF